MSKEIKISSLQLSFLIIGLIFSDFAIMNPTRLAGNDSWLAFIIGTLMGLIIVTVYLLVYRLNPEKNLVEVLVSTFGKFLGTILTILYIWYFVHISSLVLRSTGEYMVTVNYDETPILFIMISFIVFIIYILRKGIEVASRIGEIAIPFLIISVILVSVMLIDQMEVRFFSPFLKNGIEPVIKTGFGIATFPYGETIILLMIFPYLNEKNKLIKTTYISFFIAAFILFVIVIRELLILGPNILSILTYPPDTTTDLLPVVVVEPLIAINLLIGGGCVLALYIHSITLGIAQIFNFHEDRAILVPVSTIIIGVSIWLYDSLPEMFRVAEEVYPYYSIPFQIIIPLIIVITSFVKKRKSEKSNTVIN